MMGQQGVIGFSADPCQQVNRLQAYSHVLSLCPGGNTMGGSRERSPAVDSAFLPWQQPSKLPEYLAKLQDSL